MKERPILFSGEMVRAILAGKKTQTRRAMKPQPIFTYGVFDDRIYVYHTKGVCIYERDKARKWCDIEVDSRVSERGLYGRFGWTGLLSDEIQRVWEKGIRGLVSASGPYYEERLSIYFDESQQHESYKKRSPSDLLGFSRNAVDSKLTSSPSGRESIQQQAGKFEVGNPGRKLAGPESSRDCECRGTTLGIETDQRREGTSEMGNPEGALQPASRGEDTGNVSGGHLRYCPYEVGLNLWVRETWRELIDLGRDTNSSSNYVDYRADGNTDWNPDVKWRPSIFMPRWASRIMLEIVSLRVERVQDISRDDAKAEGVSNIWDWPGLKKPEYFSRGVLNPYIANYSVLWDSINAKRGLGWDVNPHVWVIEFKKVT